MTTQPLPALTMLLSRHTSAETSSRCSARTPPFPRKPKWEDLAMRGISLLCSLIGISLALVITAPTDVDAQTTALRGARVIDGSGGAPIDNAIIVIRDGRIVSIGPSAGTPVPSGA